MEEKGEYWGEGVKRLTQSDGTSRFFEEISQCRVFIFISSHGLMSTKALLKRLH